MKQSICLTAVACLFAADPALAHSPVPGIMGFYTGLLHPFSTPPQALVLIALGLAFSGFAVAQVQRQVASFLAASLTGCFLGSAHWDIDLAMLATAFAVGVLAALAPGKLSPAIMVLAGIGGFLIGTASITDSGPTSDRVITTTGAIVGANAGILILFGAFEHVRVRFPMEWVAIAFRVVAAWLAAIALLMFALGFAPSANG